MSKGWAALRAARRIVQILFLLLFLFLILRTAEPLDFSVPVNIFLRSSPLLAITAMMSARTPMIALFIPALVVIALTVGLGRVFCGWVCPFGTTLDISDRVLATLRRKRDRVSETQPRYHLVKYVLLVVLVVSAALGGQIAGWFDPICIATRTYGLVLYPYLDFMGKSVLRAAMRTNVLPEFVSWVDEAAHESVLSFTEPVYRSAILFLVIFLGIAMFGVVERRFWCRHLCPLGAALDLIARVSFLRRHVRKGCVYCLRCEGSCKMGAITGAGERTFRGECIECFTCGDVCPENVSTFAFARNKRQEAPSAGLSRRAFVGSLAGGVVAIPALKTNFAKKQGLFRFVRPPGVDNEEEFLAKCVRCGECMKVCITDGLQPALLEAGLDALWTPKLVPRVGYCEYNCTLCGQVCPTGAIPRLPEEVKHEVVLGTAFFDRNRCIPWAEDRNCAVCEEVCPRPDKAIVLRDTELKDVVTGEPLRRPHVQEDICVGCGQCENKCPIPGQAAVMVGPVRSPEDARERRRKAEEKMAD